MYQTIWAVLLKSRMFFVCSDEAVMKLRLLCGYFEGEYMSFCWLEILIHFFVAKSTNKYEPYGQSSMMKDLGEGAQMF